MPRRHAIVGALVVTCLVVFFVGWACLVEGCGGGWSASDVSTATDAVRAQMMIETLCGPNDGGTCPASQVRALERMALCADSSRLAAHGAPVPEAGVKCQAH